MKFETNGMAKFGDYNIIGTLGYGGMATVYHALHIHTQEEVALKVIHEHLLENTEMLKRFEHEIEIVEELKHPGIVPIIDYGHIHKKPYLVMPYMSNGTLADVFRKPRNIKHVASIKILKSLAPALDYAHSKGVVHRDFKLENILIDGKKRTMISDFGIAITNHQTRLTTAGNLVGTPLYIAPEQASAAGDDADYRADLYAFAVMGYLMLTGYFPFTAKDPLYLLVKHRDELAPLPSQVNQQLPTTIDNVFLRALAKEPNDRYQSAQELVEAIETSLGDELDIQAAINMYEPNPFPTSEKARHKPEATVILNPIEKPKNKPRPFYAFVSWKNAVAAILVLLLLFSTLLFTGMHLNKDANPNIVVNNSVVMPDDVTMLSGEYTLQFLIDGKDSLQITNISASQNTIALQDLQIGDNNRAVYGTNWNITSLNFGECVTVLKNMNRLDDLAENDCIEVGTPITFNQNKWNQNLNIYFRHRLIGTCLANPEDDTDDDTPRRCSITFEV